MTGLNHLAYKPQDSLRPSTLFPYEKQKNIWRDTGYTFHVLLVAARISGVFAGDGGKVG